MTLVILLTGKLFEIANNHFHTAAATKAVIHYIVDI